MIHKVERGLFELRQGRAVWVTTSDPEGSALVAAVECLGSERLRQLRSIGAQLRLCLTHHRGQAMGLASAAEPRQLSLELDGEATAEAILRLATAPGMEWTGSAEEFDLRSALPAESAGLALVRFGRLLPALVTVSVGRATSKIKSWIEDGTILGVSSAEIDRVVARPGIEVTHVTDAPVPLADAEHSRFMLFREGGGFIEHVAILIGEREEWPDPVPVRLHSACLTGDLFGSLRCDCGEQLRGSLRHLQVRGGGVLVYLAQEGRGIGLGNKMRAYTLQDEGLDTVAADGMLGFGADERRYDAAVAILHHLGIERVELLTNNPTKVQAVEEGGICVVRRKPLFGRINRHNLRYVQAKVEHSGHWLMDMISPPVSAD